MFLQFNLFRKKTCCFIDEPEVDRDTFQLSFLPGLEEIFSDPFHSTSKFGIAVVETLVVRLVPKMNVD
jgi:hypothetical protein